MGSVNRMELLGRVTRKPELKYTTNGTPYCVLGLATSYRKLNDATKQWDDVPEYHDITIWNQGNRKLAEVCVNYLDKGRLVFLEGRFRTRSWTDGEGKKRYERGMSVNNIELIDSRSGEESGGEVARPAAREGGGGDAITQAAASRTAPGEAPLVGGLTQRAIDEASNIDPDEVPW